MGNVYSVAKSKAHGLFALFWIYLENFVPLRFFGLHTYLTQKHRKKRNKTNLVIGENLEHEFLYSSLDSRKLAHSWKKIWMIFSLSSLFWILVFGFCFFIFVSLSIGWVQEVLQLFVDIRPVIIGYYLSFGKFITLTSLPRFRIITSAAWKLRRGNCEHKIAASKGSYLVSMSAYWYYGSLCFVCPYY